MSFNDAYRDQVEEKYKSYFTLDETIVAHLGYITFRQYLPDKPHPFGMLLRVMALSQCRFIVKFELYVGKLSSLSNKVEDLVPRFCSAIPQTGKKKPMRFADNFYSTFGVCDKLSMLEWRYIMTIRSNRCQKLVKPKMELNEINVVKNIGNHDFFIFE